MDRERPMPLLIFCTNVEVSATKFLTLHRVLPDAAQVSGSGPDLDYTIELRV
jgi:hypothetical protein